MATAILSRRKDFPGCGPGDHAGLLLHRGLELQSDEGHAACRALLDRLATVRPSDVYRTAVARWIDLQRTRDGNPGSVQLFTGVTSSSLALGLGNESALEVGLTLHHTYGTPIIPGSALKGLCLRAARQLLSEGKLSQPQLDALFGAIENAGHLIFWDAWYQPADLDERFLKRDVVTVHHPKYYQGNDEDRLWPTDFDDPTPIPFPVVRPGLRFVFAVEGPRADWTAFACGLLQWALENLGAGAKTNAGYGRFGAFKDLKPEVPAVRDEDWPDAVIRRKIRNKRTVWHIVAGKRWLEVPQAELQVHAQTMTRRQLELVKSDTGLLADVRVHIDHDKVSLKAVLAFKDGSSG